MGFFSWMTADTGESIANHYAAKEFPQVELRTVYLLQPDGRTPIEDARYEGYGVFSDVDAHIWLARENLTAAQLEGLDDEAVRGLGITLALGSWHVDQDTGLAWAFNERNADRLLPAITHHSGPWDEIVPQLGMTPSEAERSDRFEKRDFTRFMTKPLKFSFDPGASYEALPASEQCLLQGFFYDMPEPERFEEEIDDEDDLPLAA